MVSVSESRNNQLPIPEGKTETNKPVLELLGNYPFLSGINEPEWWDIISRAQLMESLPDATEMNKAKVVANMIACTNMILGIFSTRGMQASLMGDEYDQDAMLEQHLRLANRIFKSLVL